MRKLISFEFKKLGTIFHASILFILVCVYLMVFLFHIWQIIPSNYASISSIQNELVELYNSDNTAFNTIYQIYLDECAEYETQQYSALYNGDNRSIPEYKNFIVNQSDYGDRELFSDIQSIVEAPEKYENAIRTLLHESSVRMRDMEINGETDNIMYRYYAELVHLYSSFYQQSFPIAIVRGWDIYFSSDISSVFLLIILLILFCDIFTKERRFGIDSILVTTKNGHVSIIVAKLCCVMITTTGFVILFSLFSLVICKFTTGLSDVTVCIQAITGFIYCPYSISIGEYFIINLGYKILFFNMIALINAVLAQWVHNELISFGFSLFALITGIVAKNTNAVNAGVNLTKIGYFNISNGMELFSRYSYVNIFENPINALYTCIGSIIVLIIMMWIVSIVCGINRVSYSHCSENQKIYIGLQRKPKLSINGAERYKWISDGVVPILLALLLLKCVISGLWYRPNSTHDELLFREYLEEVQGPVTEEKLQFISTEMEYIEHTITEYSVAEAAYRQGSMSLEELKRSRNRYYYAQYYENACRKLYKYREYIVSVMNKYENVCFINEEGIFKILGAVPDVVMLLAVMVLFGNIFSREYETGFFRILRITKNGRKKVLISKIVLAATTILILYVLFTLIDVLFLCINYNIDFHANIKSLPMFAFDYLSLSIGEYLIISKILSGLGVLLSLLLMLSISIICEKQLIAYFVWGLSIGLPYIAEQYGFTYIYLINIVNIVSCQNITKGLISCVFYGIIVIIVGVGATRKWNGSNRI